MLTSSDDFVVAKGGGCDVFKVASSNSLSASSNLSSSTDSAENVI
jgi:hypothetical protein